MRSSTLAAAAAAVVLGSPTIWAQNTTAGSTTNSTLPASTNGTAASNTTTAPSTGGSTWSPSASTNPGTNPLIPTTLSTNCQAFLARLNSNSQVATCLAPLISATSLFAAGTTEATSQQLEGALDGLCAEGLGCGQGLVSDVLSHFSGNCSAELGKGVQEVVASYDALYILTPFKAAVCSKDSTTNAYCMTSIAAAATNTSVTASSSASPIPSVASSSSSFGSNTTAKLVAQTSTTTTTAEEFAAIVNSAGQSGNSLVTQLGASAAKRARSLFSRQSTSTSSSTTIPNGSSFTALSLPFLFLTPSLPSHALCSACTSSILTSFVAFEQQTPYPVGLGSSGLLSGQSKLWKGVGERCGDGFLASVQSKAGGAIAGTSAAGSVRVWSVGGVVVVAMSMVVFAL